MKEKTTDRNCSHPAKLFPRFPGRPQSHQETRTWGTGRDQQQGDAALINSLAKCLAGIAWAPSIQKAAGLSLRRKQRAWLWAGTGGSLGGVFTPGCYQLCSSAAHMCACALCKQLKTPTGPLVGSLKQKCEGFALMSNQNSVFIRAEKDLNAFALCADAL